MSDSSDLVVVLGELDRVLSNLEGDEGETARSAAAALLPPYGDAGAPGWYDRFLAATGFEPEATTLTEAMRNLARAPRSRSALPYRVIAIGAVARALPATFGPDGDQRELTWRALSVPGILASSPGVRQHTDDSGERVVLDEAPEFLLLLVDPTRLPHVGAYREFLDLDEVDALVHTVLAGLPPPCTTEVIEVSRGAELDLVLALTTRVCVTGVALADVTTENGFLNPGNWARYSYWCAMVPDPGNAPDPGDAARFLEIVALDCDTDAFEVAVWLDFSRTVRLPNAVLRTYEMSADQQSQANGRRANGAVDIDEGSIKVVDEGDRLRVTTTKRVHFTTAIDGPSLAIIACGAGYGALAAAFVVEGTGGVAQDVGCAHPGTTTASADESTPVDPVRSRIDAVGRSVDECAAAFKSSVDKVAAGTYKADDLAADVTGSVTRSVRAWGRLLDLAAVIGRPPPTDPEIVSDPFTLDPPIAGSGEVRLAGPLVSPYNDELPVERVRARPAPLPGGADRFELVVRAAGLRGTTYVGVAVVTELVTDQKQHVNVDVQIP
jgi:hypothetical protein